MAYTWSRQRSTSTWPNSRHTHIASAGLFMKCSRVGRESGLALRIEPPNAPNSAQLFITKSTRLHYAQSSTGLNYSHPYIHSVNHTEAKTANVPSCNYIRHSLSLLVCLIRMCARVSSKTFFVCKVNVCN